jgi:hypothetical protein
VINSVVALQSVALCRQRSAGFPIHEDSVASVILAVRAKQGTLEKSCASFAKGLQQIAGQTTSADQFHREDPKCCGPFCRVNASPQRVVMADNIFASLERLNVCCGSPKKIVESDPLYAFTKFGAVAGRSTQFYFQSSPSFLGTVQMALLNYVMICGWFAVFTPHDLGLSLLPGQGMKWK